MSSQLERRKTIGASIQSIIGRVTLDSSHAILDVVQRLRMRTRGLL